MSVSAYVTGHVDIAGVTVNEVAQAFVLRTLKEALAIQCVTEGIDVTVPHVSILGFTETNVTSSPPSCTSVSLVLWVHCAV